MKARRSGLASRSPVTAGCRASSDSPGYVSANRSATSRRHASRSGPGYPIPTSSRSPRVRDSRPLAACRVHGISGVPGGSGSVTSSSCSMGSVIGRSTPAPRTRAGDQAPAAQMTASAVSSPPSSVNTRPAEESILETGRSVMSVAPERRAASA